MLRRFAAYLAMALGFALGVALSYTPLVLAARNSSGTYSLPSGNPVVSGTTITPAWANTTLSDMGSEVTNSLDRNGRGAMQAPLQCTSGTASAPAVTFSSDTDTGMYRCAANELCFAAGGNKIVGVTTSGPSVTGTLTATASASNTSGASITGNGTAAGAVLTGGSTGRGVTAVGGGGSAVGAHVTGGPTGSGIDAYAGGSPTADTNTRWAVYAGGGHIALGGGNPSSTTGFANTLTPMNVPKAWARVANGTPAVSAGFNVASVADNGTHAIDVNFQQDFADTNYACVASGSQVAQYMATNASAGTVTVIAYDLDGNAIDLSDSGGTFNIVCFGAQ